MTLVKPEKKMRNMSLDTGEKATLTYRRILAHRYREKTKLNLKETRKFFRHGTQGALRFESGKR